MAQTTGVIDGSLMRITIGGNAIAYATTASFNMSRATTERVHKDLTNGQTEIKLNELTNTVSGEGFYSFDGTNNTFDVLFDAMVAGTALTVLLTTSNSGDIQYSFTARLTSLSSSHEARQDSTFSYEMAIDGAVTKTTIS